MTVTRFNGGDPNGVPSGYAGTNVPNDINVPAVGIEDLDRAIFTAFEQDLHFEVSNTTTGDSKKVPVIYAAGEKWAMLKNGKALRDKTNTLILPLITIRRVKLQQDMATDITGRGINQQTGELVIKRRLNVNDRDYQKVANKLGINNQTNLATLTPVQTLSTTRNNAQNTNDLDILDGALLAPKLGNNVYEIITIPSPQFFSTEYEVVFWAQYQQHMNELTQKLISSYLPQGNAIRLDTPKGYWFIATVVDNSFELEDNGDDMTSEERFIKCKITVHVPGYMVATDTPGTPGAVRRTISAPFIVFNLDENIDVGLSSQIPNDDGRYENADDPTATTQHSYLNLFDKKNNSNVAQKIQRNPFAGKDETVFARVVSKNSKTGETVLLPDNNLTIKIV
jgi:hypothetical protein